MAIQIFSTSSEDVIQQREVLRFNGPTFSAYLGQVRRVIGITQGAFVDRVNERIILINERLPPDKEQILTITPKIYTKLEEHGRFPAFEELEPMYQAFSLSLTDPFSPAERECYITLAQARLAERKRRPKNGQIPTASDWQTLVSRLISFDRQRETLKNSKALSLVPLPKIEEAPEIHLSAQVESLRKLNTNSILERDSYIEEMIRLWESGKRLVITKAISGAGKTRAFYVLLKALADRQHHWPFYYALKRGSGNQTPDDHLDTLLSSLATDLRVSPGEEKPLARAVRIEQLFTEMVRCSKQGLHLAVLLDDAHLLLDPATGAVPPCWQEFFDLWVGREHSAVLLLATQEWPRWTGKDRRFLKEVELAPLSPSGGAELWKQCGFDDVAMSLLEEAARKCEGYPQWIEVRASDLDEPEHHYLWPEAEEETFTSQSTDNEHTKRIKAWLKQETIFAAHDIGAQAELTQIFSRQLSHHTQQVLDLLAVAPLGIPFSLLEQEADHLIQAIDELARCSLVDRSSRAQKRATLISLAREARLYQLSMEQREQLEQRVTNIYTRWLYELQQFTDESEMGSLVSELSIIYLKQYRLLEAVGLIIEYGWLPFSFGSGPRLARVADAALATSTWRDGDNNEIGGTLLYHYLGQYAGRVNKTSKRAADYQHIVALARAKQIPLHVTTEVQLFHYQLLALLNQNQFLAAQQLLNEMTEHLRPHEGSLASISFLSDVGLFYATWGDYAKEMGDRVNEITRREQAIAAHRQALAILEQQRSNSPLTTIRTRKNMARQLNNLSCYLVDLQRHEEAVPFLRESINIKHKLHVLPYSLAAGLGELAMALMASGHYQEALSHCEEALLLVQQASDAGNSIAHTELPVYKVNKARILVRIGQWEAAEYMIQEAEKQGIREERRIYKAHAKSVREEIQGCRQTATVLGQHYLDWRWIQRYRACIDYDVFGWLSHSGPFTADEQAEWNRLLNNREQEASKHAMASLMKKARDRELQRARQEQQEPQLCYPAIPLEELATRTQQLEHLAQDITREEPNAIVKRLYLDAIAEQLAWFHLINATAQGDSEAFWHASQELYTPTYPDEMRLALHHLGGLIARGKKLEQTAAVSQMLLHSLQKWQLLEYTNVFFNTADKPSSLSVTHTDQRKVSPQVAKRFFEEVFRLYHIPNWRVTLDRAANNLRIEQNTRELILSDTGTLSVARVRELLSHEIECHILRSVRGELSNFGLLALGTRRSLITEEGLALYYDDMTARKVHGTVVDDSTPSTWLGTLAIGLARGVLTSPRSFAETLPFFEEVYFLIQLLTNETEDTEKARARATRLALNRCLRTYRGVPDLNTKGICFTKDVVYFRGFHELRRYIQEDPSIIDRLLVGVMGLEQLSDLAELGIIYPDVRHQWLAHRQDLDDYILSFQ